jgi:hypothetical protein
VSGGNVIGGGTVEVEVVDVVASIDPGAESVDAATVLVVEVDVDVVAADVAVTSSPGSSPLVAAGVPRP